VSEELKGAVVQYLDYLRDSSEFPPVTKIIVDLNDIIKAMELRESLDAEIDSDGKSEDIMHAVVELMPKYIIACNVPGQLVNTTHKVLQYDSRYRRYFEMAEVRHIDGGYEILDKMQEWVEA
jgi:hypothetical protein